MICDICLFKFCSGKQNQYPTLEYAKDIIGESRKLTFPLRGKRQLTLIKRGNSGKILLYTIYNYVYNDKKDSVGICIVFYDKYPHDIDFLFKFCGSIIADIIEEGKAFHFDPKGNIISDNNDLEFHHSTLSKHKDKIKVTLQDAKAKVRQIPKNIYNNYEDQHVICQLSDKSWSLDEMFKTNNIVIITEEIEDENINSMRSFIKKSNETVDDLNKRIRKLEEQLKKAESEKNRLSQTNGLQKQVKNTNDNEIGVIAWIILGVIVAIILINVIAPWFIPSLWPKLSVVFTGLGIYLVINALEDETYNKTKEILGWSGAVAILLSMIITIYGICGGFSPDNVDKGENDLTNEVLKAAKEEVERNDRNVSEDIISTKITSTIKIPKDFVLVPAGALKNESEWKDNREVVYNVKIDSFYICKYELTQAEYKRIVGTLLPENYTWGIHVGYKDEKVVQLGDNVPVIGTYQEFAEYCNKRSRMEGYDGFYEIEGNRVKVKHDGNGYRLLNHFEWTYAARGGKANERFSYAGSNKIGEVAWYGGNSRFRPHEVGNKKANSLGIYDMSGNVSEMLLDDPKCSSRLIGGEGFDCWVNLGPNDILGMFEKNGRNGTRIALIPKNMTNNNTKLTWKYHW